MNTVHRPPAATGAFAARHRDGLAAAALAAAFGALYVATLCPTVFWYDSAEYAAAAVTLGIPHPPGYPLYTLLGALFALLPVEPAYATNLMSAVFGALAVALAFCLGRRLGLGTLAASMGAATLGTSQLFWSQAVITEVYTTALAVLLLVLLLLERGLRQARAWPLLAAAFVAGLGLGVHLSLATCGVGLVLLVWGTGTRITRPAELRQLVGRAGLGRRLGVVAGCAGAAVLGACIFLYLPLRAAMKPPLMMADASTWDGFWWLVTGGNYKGWFLRAPDFLARAGLVGGILYDQLLAGGAALAALGVAHWLRRQPLFGLGLLLAAAGNVWFFFDYDVHDVEVFFLPAVLALCLFTGAGAQLAFDAIARVATAPRARALGAAARLLALAVPLSLLLANYSANDHSQRREAREFGERAVRELPRGSVVLNFSTPDEWQKDAVFGKYFQLVEKARPDVTVALTPSPQDVLAWLRAGTPVFLYAPVHRVLQHFRVEPAGDFGRVVGPRAAR